MKEKVKIWDPVIVQPPAHTIKAGNYRKETF